MRGMVAAWFKRWLHLGARGQLRNRKKKGGSAEVVGVVSALRNEEWQRLQRWLLFWDSGQLRRSNGGGQLQLLWGLES